MILAILALTATFLGIIWTFGSKAVHVVKRGSAESQKVATSSDGEAKPKAVIDNSGNTTLHGTKIYGAGPGVTPLRNEPAGRAIVTGNARLVGRGRGSYGAENSGDLHVSGNAKLEGDAGGLLNKPPPGNGGNVSVGRDLNGNVCTSGATCNFNYQKPQPPKAIIAGIEHIQRNEDGSYLVVVDIDLETESPINRLLVSTPISEVVTCGPMGFSIASGQISSGQIGGNCISSESAVPKGRYPIWMKVRSPNARPAISIKLNDADPVELKYPPA
jgi:hypothetical protein